MNRLLLPMAIAVLPLTAPARANDTPPPAWEGVWRGTIGTLPVYVCLDRGRERRASGSYYYQRVMRPIPLERDNDGPWRERGNIDQTITGRWSVAIDRSGNLSGQWRAGERVLPVALSRVRSGPSENGPCGSEAFLAPRLTPIRQTSGPARLGSFRYQAVRYNAGRAFPDYEIVGVSYPVSQPGDTAINRALRLDLLRPDGPADYRICERWALSSLGISGFMEIFYRPNLVTDEYISVAVSEFGSCGGASPYNALWSRAFDRQSGQAIDLAQWFVRSAVVSAEYESYGRVNSVHLQPSLRRLVLRRYTRRDADCTEVVESQDYWQLKLESRGISFLPSLARVVQACGDEVLVPFAELAPLLSPAGRRGAARLGWR